MSMMIIDANELIVGRLASFAAKQALLGEKVDVINCEKAIFTGSKSNVLEKYQSIMQKGNPHTGPFLPRMSDRFVRKIIKRMLPYKQEKGIQAFRRIMCHIGTPLELQGKETQTIEGANASKLKTMKTVTVAELCNLLRNK